MVASWYHTCCSSRIPQDRQFFGIVPYLLYLESDRPESALGTSLASQPGYGTPKCIWLWLMAWIPGAAWQACAVCPNLARSSSRKASSFPYSRAPSLWRNITQSTVSPSRFEVIATSHRQLHLGILLCISPSGSTPGSGNRLTSLATNRTWLSEAGVLSHSGLAHSPVAASSPLGPHEPEILPLQGPIGLVLLEGMQPPLWDPQLLAPCALVSPVGVEMRMRLLMLGQFQALLPGPTISSTLLPASSFQQICHAAAVPKGCVMQSGISTLLALLSLHLSWLSICFLESPQP